MKFRFEIWPTLAFTVVVISWAAFVIVFLTGRKETSAPERKREGTSIIGIVFQGLSYAAVWTFHRQPFTPLTPSSKPLEITVAMLTIMLAFSSVWFFHAAIRTLGKQWSLAARVVEGHKLVTEGAYRIVRNPIYTAMFGMLLATGLAISTWPGLIIAVVLFVVGTTIRIRSEEKLLRNAFGAEFDAYAQKVPLSYRSCFEKKP